ncbi:MAG TPA: hypothetical protein VN285_12065, partial [Candidatus Deferrimicrobium sp.]|nr:hypothetical protein [Candidatus Deferrimicrobium sp.]
NLSANPDVHDVFVIGDTIWIATSAGLAVADKSNPILLNQPSVWTVFQNAQYPELQTSDFRRVVQFEGAIWTATAKGLSRLDRSSLDTSFTLLAGVSRTIYSELKIENDSLFAYNPYGMGVVKNSVYSTISLQGRPSGLITGANNGTFRWVGFSGNGVSHDRDLSGVVIPYPFTGSPGNYVTGIAVDRAGAVTAGFWDRKAGQFDGQVWTNVETRDWTTDVALDSSGVVWIGTWGGGIAGVHEDTVVYYDETNSTMRGIPSAPSFVVARGVAVDRRYIYAVCYDALNGYPVAIGDLQSLDTPSGWDSLGLADGVTNQLLVSVDCYKSRLAIGTEAAGVFVCYLGDDPFDHQARHCDHYTTESGLNSDVVRTVRYAPTGELWVGTNFGAARWDLDRFVAVQPPQGIGNDIMAIEFDGRGNLWLGSNDGLARVDGATGQATVYTTRTSGLVSDDITNLSFDPFTGDLYVATRAGISRLRSTIGRPTADVESVLAFPNPFVIRSDLDRLNFNFSRSGAVRIFSLAGELVAEFPVNTAWDGRNARGERVASGVYIFILTDSDGNVGRGKVLVVHEE